MSTPSVLTVDRAADLPPAWDRAASHGLLHRSILELLEQVNPCQQRYHFVPGVADGPPSLAVTYRHRLNLLTFAPRIRPAHWPLRMVGLPCSVAAPGLQLGDPTSAAALLDFLRHQPGITLILNTREAALGPDFASGPTLPSCRLAIAWPDFTSYLAALRSPYRRRIRQALARGAGLTAEVLPDPSRFDATLHQLYLQVFRRSRYPLECLSESFFRRFPASLTVFRAGTRAVGFVQSLREGDRLIFLFGGLEDEVRRTHDTYWNMLLHLVRTGIETGCREIDFGQTAETTKLRLGARPVPLHLHATHRAPALRWVLRRLSGGLSYAPCAEEPHVFR